MQIQANIGGILYDRGGKAGSNCPDLELGKEFLESGSGYPVPTTNH